MTYQPLARKYRPSRFSEMVGQDGVALALANAIAMGREPHALLFTGVRGVGKTTVARLYAKALNCEDRQAGSEPCGHCESCLAIASGRHEDVLEIDGASNTGVGDVRALQETVDYVPQRSRFKVYIIDEVHMLSQAAFNALLKTLEEPPPHVVFVFATTELNKVPQTILSRCQAFYLRKLPQALIRNQLAHILSLEGIEAEERALAIIAREGHGSMRDALTLLDQAIALSDGKVTVASLGPIVSNLSSSPYLEVLAAMVARDAKRAMAELERLDQAGAEFATVAEEVANLARHGFVIQGLSQDALDVRLLGLDDGEINQLVDIAASARPFDLNRIFRTVVKARTELDGSALDRYIFENYVYEWCFDPGLPDIDALLAGAQGSGASSSGSGAVSRLQAESAVAPAAPRARMKDMLSELRAQSQGARAPQAKDPQAAAAPQARAPSEKGSPTATAAPTRGAATPVPQEAEPHEKTSASVAPATASSDAAAKQELGRVSEPEAATPEFAGERAGAQAADFPETWRLLVDAWRAKKPLSARKLEEVHPLVYSPERIVLAVSEQSFASKGLLQKDEQMRVREQFRELFGFTGQLIVQPLGAEGGEVAEGLPVDGQTLPETVLDARVREGAARLERLKAEVRDAPFTRDLLATLGGTIEDVKIPDGEHP